jgi:arylsulfatase
MTRPNVIWICTDQQRYDTLGCYGNEAVRTPNVDQLASRGVQFNRCFSQSPVCTPSRASFLTGRYPRTTRCRQNGQAMPADEVLVTKLLADAGYTCGLAGKLHISPCNPSVCPSVEPRIADGYSMFHWSHHPMPDWPTNEYLRWLHEKGARYATPKLEGSRYVERGMPAELHQTTWCAQMAINFIEASAGFDTPWLFSVNMFDPHHPFDPPAEYIERYLVKLEDVPLPNYVPGELDDKPEFQRRDHLGAYDRPGWFAYSDMSPDDHRLIRAAYWAMCDLIDEQVGRLLDALERTGQLDNTLVVFTSDHGEMLGDHGIYLKGAYFYEPAIRVPLIVAGPGVASGVTSDALVELMDLAPTLLDAAGEPRYPGMQAKSLWPLLTGRADPASHRDDVYCEYYNPHTYKHAQITMVRTDRHKIAVCHGLHTGELYDLVADPNETRNLWGDPDYADVKAAMIERVMDRMAWTVDPLPERVAFW